MTSAPRSGLETVQQETDEIEKAKAAGIEFFKLSDADMATLQSAG